ncbi:MAG: hypothetical protein CVT48_00020 [Thermoplasmata archaeon HGW-Thermoplasmata-1]|nr:MAG: hypothetical protein CVT48_00020 [Thermoplasmata archaeon HGW-Thermoplasmata-1]
MDTIVVHSYKGGTGKTNISLNLAAVAAMQGKRVCLLEFDLESPNLHNIIPMKSEMWLNDYLDGNGCVPDVLTDATGLLGNGVSGELRVGLANPEMDAVRKSVSSDRNAQLNSLKRFMQAKKELKDYDYVIIDTSPGVTYASINAVLSADKILLVAKPDNFDIDGTSRLIQEFYGGLQKKMGLVVNKVIRPEHAERVANAIDAPMLAAIPCYCELPQSFSSSVFVRENPEHPFTGEMVRLLEKIGSL